MPDAKLHGSMASISLGDGYALRSPGLSGLARLLGPRVAGSPGPEMVTRELDRVFEDAPNDLVVPTAGMRSWGEFEIPPRCFLSFSPARSVIHTKYFAQPETSASLLQWL